MQESIIFFFHSISSPLLDQAAQLVTILGEQSVYMIVLAVFFWGVSKKTGLIMSATLLISLWINNFLKLLFHTPRPFEVMEGIQGKRLQTATGYSFPSGHTQGASSFYTTLFYLFKKPVVRIISVLIILLVGLSRIYLGVHWPVDVLGGWGLGILTAWVTASAIDRLWNNPPRLNIFLTAAAAVAGVVTLIMILLELFVFRGQFKTDDFFKSSGILIGAFSGFLLEGKICNFDPREGRVPIRVLRIILGLGGLLLLQEGLKILFPGFYLFHTLRYLIMGFWITFLFPWLGCRAGLFSSNKNQ